MFKIFTPAIFLAFIGAIVASFAVFAKSRGIPFPAWDLIIDIAAIAAALGALWNSYEQNIFQTKIQEQSKKIEVLTSTNLEKSDKIIELSTYVNNSMTGGNSIPYVIIDRSTKNPSKLDVSIRIIGDFPLYGVKVKIQHNGTEESFPVGDLSNKYPSSLGHIGFPENRMNHYFATVFCRSGVFHQKIFLEKRRHSNGHEIWHMKKSETFHHEDSEFKNPIYEFSSEDNTYTVIE
jgi:hypothetical protein